MERSATIIGQLHLGRLDLPPRSIARVARRYREELREDTSKVKNETIKTENLLELL